jgi:DNA polymerase II
MAELKGWLLDLFADTQPGIVLWLIGEDGQRHRLTQDFPVTFYAAGEPARLRQLWRFLRAQPEKVELKRTERRDIFSPGPVQVLEATMPNTAAQPYLFNRVAAEFPELPYYDADLPLTTRHAALYNTFPLVHCQMEVDEHNLVQGIEPLDTPWELDPPAPPLRLMALEPDVDPEHDTPRNLLVRSMSVSYRLSLENPRPLLVNLRAILERQDPDVLMTAWGDTWLLPYLIDLAEQWHIPLPLNREPNREVIRKDERSYMAYGRVIYRGRQVHLFGRWHIDGCNAMMFHEYGLEGVYELARVTALAGQVVARVSPGSGISAMQMVTALRLGIMVPWHKQQAERPKTALEMMQADQGGMVYQPLIGLHHDVGEVDFISMYPSIMRHFNISPETVVDPNTVGRDQYARLERVSELGLWIDQETSGLIPQTLAPLLDKRLELKLRLAELPAWDPRRTTYQAQATAHKWLLVTCFGYLGYKNARFGRIEAHEAVTAYGREMLLRAKEAAEDLGYTVLHMYVDGLWVKKKGHSKVADFQSLLEEITSRTGLPIALDGIYRWVAFLPSRLDERVPVPNRYFGVFQDGSLKMRGIEVRRHDTPTWVSDVQLGIIDILVHTSDVGDRGSYMPKTLSLIRKALTRLRAGKVPIEDLLVSLTLSRELSEYRTPSPAARAAAQLAAIGKNLRPGQRVRFVYTLGEPGVHAWDLPQPLDMRRVDQERYKVLLLRAAAAILQPFGVQEEDLKTQVFAHARDVTFFTPVYLNA